jgi:hypothetical protein
MFSPKTARLLKQAHDTSPVPPKKTITKKIVAAVKSSPAPQLKKKPAASKKVIKKAVFKKPAAKPNAQGSSRPFSSDFGILYITKATHQSYIQFIDHDMKKKLLVAIAATKCKNHHVAIDELALYVCSVSCISKEDVLQKREELIARNV